MKDKTLTGLLALFLGAFGVHRFYLGQVKLGILYIFLLFFGISLIIGLIDAILFLTMDQATFDDKYNYKDNFGRTERRRPFPPKYNREERHQKYVDHRKTAKANRPTPPPVVIKKKNPYKQSGVQKYKDYDFEAAIADFKKALAIDSKDIAVHFNLACAYSITEQAAKSLHHLSKAVEHGFVDFDKIKEHDALAYLRIQDEFEEFVKNGYRLNTAPTKQEETTTTTIDTVDDSAISTDLLDQIKKLGELREKGFLTEEEFVAQKRRLLR
jgi:TM2 domain-containing membrane protein YozV